MAEVNLLPAYLINGEDQLKRETVLKRLRSRLEAMGDLDFNCDTFDGKDALGGDIVAACNTMPFGIDKRLVIVRNADDLKKADSEALVAYLASPADFTVLACLRISLRKTRASIRLRRRLALRRSSIARRARRTNCRPRCAPWRHRMASP